MSEFNKRLFEEKIGKDGMDSYDNDLKFMGAHEICKMVQHGQLKAEADEMNKYIQALFKQLKPENTSDVKGNAVTCISRICSKLTEQQIEKVVTQLIEYITNDTKEYEDIRDVFVMCMKNIIQEVPHDFHEKLSIVLIQADQGIKKASKNKKHKIEQELVEIVTLMFRKWGNIYRDAKYKGLIQQLKQNIILPGIDDNLRKKSCISLGAVSVMLDTQEVAQLVTDLITAHKQISNPNAQQAQLKGIASALNSLTKTVGQKMEGQVNDLINLLQSQYKNWKLQEDAEDFDFVAVVCELYESYLSIIENLLKACSRKCFTQKMKDDIILIGQELLTMDPNRSCNIQDMEEEFNDEDDEDGMEEESDDDYLDSDVDQDDQSWRVRKSVLHLVEQLILMDKQTLNQVYHNFLAPNLPARKNIIKRLVERNEGVRQTIINVLTTFINQIMVNDSNIHYQNQQSQHIDIEEDFGDDLQLKRITSKLVSFDILDVIGPIIKEIKNIYNDKKSNTHIKISAFRLIDNLSSSAGKQILENQTAWRQIYEIEKDILQDQKADTEIKILILSSLKKIIKFRQQSNLSYLKNDLQEILKIITQLLNNKQFKIKAGSYKLFSGILRILNQCFMNDIDLYKGEIQKIIPVVLSDLNQTDIDQEIKHTVISCANNLLNNVLNLLNQDQINSILESTSKKLKSENKNRILILKLLRRLPLNISTQLNNQSYQIINSIIEICSTFLKKEDRSDRISSLEALDTLLKIQDKQCDKKLLKTIIEQSLQMIEPRHQRDLDPSQADLVLQIYYKILCIDNTNNEKYQQILQGCLFLTTTNIFQSNRYESLYNVFSKLAELKIIDSEKIISQLVSESQTTTITASSCAIAALVQVSQNQSKKNQSKISLLINQFCNFFNHESGALIQKIASIALTPHQSQDQIPQRQCCLQSLCEIGKTINLTTNKQIFDKVLELINNQDESLDLIRKYASIAFGGMSIQNLENSLPKVIDFINQKKNPYLMLNTLKEIIQNSNQINEKQLSSIVDFLFNQASQVNDSKESDIRNIVSGCIGKLGVHNLSYLKQRLQQGLKSNNENLRYNCASSFKFFFTKDILKNNEQSVLAELASLLMECISDPSNQVKEAIVKSLNSIAFNLPHIIEQKVKKEFFVQMIPCFEHFDVQETDLGAFKDKRDKGAILRAASFQFLQSALHFKYSYEFSDEILQVCIGNMKKESENDIKLLRAQILLKLTKTYSQVVTPHCLKVKDAMVDIMKVFVGSKPIPESSLELVKTCCAVLDQVDKHMDQKNSDYQTFLSKLKVQDKGKFGQIFEAVQDW